MQKEKRDISARKQFKEMSIKERVLYLVESPTYAPKLKCEVNTENQSYRGIITEFKDDTVFIQVPRKSVATQVPLANIKDIRLIGF